MKPVRNNIHLAGDMFASKFCKLSFQPGSDQHIIICEIQVINCIKFQSLAAASLCRHWPEVKFIADFTKLASHLLGAATHLNYAARSDKFFCVLRQKDTQKWSFSSPQFCFQCTCVPDVYTLNEVKDVFFSREDLFKRKCSQTVSELSKANIAQEWCDTFLRPLAYVFIGVVYWVSEGFYGIARCCFSICVPGKLVFHGAFMEHICMDNL